MLFYDRWDGARVRGLRAFNAILPYILRKRNEAAVFFSKDIEVEAAMSYVRRKNGEGTANTGPGPERYSLFGLLIAAAVRTIALKPRLNRFVHRRAVYRRKGISVSFIVKKTLTEAATEGSAKILFEPEDDVAMAVEKINDGIESVRSGAPGPDDREFDLAHRLPFGKAAITLLFRVLDSFNVAPSRMIEADPLFTSIYVANLGSIGLDTPYHNLYEWGTASLVMVVGRVFQKETRRSSRGAASGVELKHYVNLKFTVDERIAEGIYFAHAAALFQRFIAKPETLELPLDLSEAEA
ncbi:MAG: hypothetical protein ABSF43_15815 [Rectinemataceae bacterium]|jgi:hypothetical protein